MAKRDMTLKAVIALETKKAMSGLQKFQNQLSSVGKSLISAFGIGSVTMFARSVINAGKDFEDSMARVKAVSNATVAEFETMTKAAQQMGATTKYTASEAAQALETLTRNGMKATEAAQALPAVLKFAQANAISLAESADILKVNLNMFSLATSDATRVADVFSTTAANTATNVLEINEAMVNAAPAAKVLGLSIEEVASSIGALANKGVVGANAGTQIRMALTKMVDPRIVATMKKMGIEVDETTIKAEGLYKTLQKFADKNVSLEDLVSIFSQRGAVGMQQMIGGLEDMRYMLAQIENQSRDTIGTTERMFQDGVGAMKMELDTLKSKWEATLISWSTGSSSPVIGIVRFLQNLADMLRNNVGSALLALSSVALPLVVKGVTNLVKAFKTLKTAISEMKLASLSNIFTAIAQALLLVTTAVVGNIQKMNRPIKEAREELDKMTVEAQNTREEMDKLSSAMSKLNKDTGENDLNFQTFVSLLEKIKALFPDLGDAVEEAGKRAFKSGNWEDFKKTLEDIYALQNKISQQSAYKDLYEAQVNKMRMAGLNGPSMSTNQPAQFGTSGMPARDWSGLNALENIAKALNKKGYGDTVVSNLQNQLIQAVIENLDNETAKNEINTLLERYGIAKTIQEQYNDAFADTFIKAVKNSDLYKETLGTFNAIQKNIQDTFYERYNILDSSFRASIQGLDPKKDASKIQSLANNYKSQLENLGVEATEKGFDYFAKGMQEGIKQLERAYNLTSIQEATSTLAEAETDTDKLSKVVQGFVEDEKKLNNKRANNRLTAKELEDELNKLGNTTVDSISEFGKFDEVIKTLTSDLQEAAERALGYSENLKKETKAEEERDKQKTIQEENAEKLKEFYKLDPKERTRNTSNDYQLTQNEINKANLKVANQRVEDLEESIRAMQKFSYQTTETLMHIEELKVQLVKLKKEAKDLNSIVALQQTIELADEKIKVLENATADKGIKYISSFEQVTSDMIGFIEALEDISDKEIINEKNLKVINGVINGLNSLISVIKTLETIYKLAEAADDLRTTKKVLNSSKVVAADMAATTSARELANAELAAAVAGTAASQAKWGPYLAAIGAFSVAAAIAAASTKKFSKGGIVPGTSLTGDNVPAMLNSREMVITTGQQKTLFDLLNGKGTAGGGEVQFKISGDSLVGVLRNKKLLSTGRL